MITDRTQADVDSVTKNQTSVNKGAYNYTDLNRVENKVKELNTLLQSYNYIDETLTTKLDWSYSDKFNVSDMQRYLGNIQKIRNAFSTLQSTPLVPTTINYMSYETANNIEKILVDIEKLIYSMKNYFVYSGVANSGQVRLWQNRFRHFYTELTYLEANGTQYIDTGFKHNQNTRFVADMEFSNVKSYTYPFGSFGGAQANQLLFVGELDNNNPHKIGTYYKTKYGFSSILAEGRHTFDLNKNVHTVDSTSHTYTYTNFASIYNDLIFGATTYDGSLRTTATNIKLYSFKIYDNGTLVRDYIPVLDYYGVPCLYDKVEDKFYYNSGTGEFLYG